MLGWILFWMLLCIIVLGFAGFKLSLTISHNERTDRQFNKLQRKLTKFKDQTKNRIKNLMVEHRITKIGLTERERFISELVANGTIPKDLIHNKFRNRKQVREEVENGK